MARKVDPERTFIYRANQLTNKEVRDILESGDQKAISILKQAGVLDMYLENMAGRQSLKSSGVRQLQKAIGMQAMVDYVTADEGCKVGSMYPEEVKDECTLFFKTGMFKAMYGETDPKKVIAGLKKYRAIKEELEDLPEQEREQRRWMIIHGKEKV